MPDIIRTLRPAPEPLGSFIRPGYNDHTVVAQALAEQRGTGSGIVLDPTHADRQLPLVAAGNSAGVETVLDVKSLELATPGGFARSGVQALPWANPEHPHTPLDLTGPGGTRLVTHVGEYVAEHNFSAALAPTHLLGDLQSPWWGIDAALTQRLRAVLNEVEMTETLIYYPVTVRLAALAESSFRQRLLAHLAALPIDGIWLRVHPFGTNNSGPLVLTRYLALCRQLHRLGIPIVAEHSGSIGVALLAFGAVGGIESGVTFSDTVNIDGLLRTPDPDKKGFAPASRVYLHRLGGFVDLRTAGAFFERRGIKVSHGCQDTTCCPGGWKDMLAEPRRHFLRQRHAEVRALTAMPPGLRAGHYMENFLRPASDRAARAAELEPSIKRVRQRLDSWRGTLGADLERHASASISAPAAGRRLRVRPSA